MASSLYNPAARLADLGRREDAPTAIEEATSIRRKLLPDDLTPTARS